MVQSRWVDVDPERLSGWVMRFAARHGGQPVICRDGEAMVLRAPDGEIAECHLPPGAAWGESTTGDLMEDFVTRSAQRRTLGLLLIRRGGFAAAVAEGEELIASKVDSRYVQSRTAAGGWSQQRFARRRQNQAKAAVGEAVEVCGRVLLPHRQRLAAVVTGGDRSMVEAVMADTRLDSITPLVASRFLPVPDPKLAVVREALRQARAVRIHVVHATS